MDGADRKEMARRARELRSWLLNEIGLRRWTQADFVRAINEVRERTGRGPTSASSISKWLLPPTAENYRVPTYQSCLDIADALGVDQNVVLRKAGRLTEHFDREPERLTALQRDAIALVSLLPDSMLVSLIPQMRALVNNSVQEQVLQRLHDIVEDDEVPFQPVEAHAP